LPKRGAQLNFGAFGIKEFPLQSWPLRCSYIKRVFSHDFAVSMRGKKNTRAEEGLPKWARILLELKAQVKAGKPAARR